MIYSEIYHFMHPEIKTLNLLRSYEFDVLIEENNNWFAGKLKLSPEIIVFRVAGEECGKRKFKDKWRDKKHLICKDANRTFLLFGLRLITGKERILGGHSDGITFFEYSYVVDYAIHFPGDNFGDFSITGLRIYSSTIADWTGNTNTQRRISKKYSTGSKITHDEESLFELEATINDKIFLGIYYNVSMYWSPHEFKSGLMFPPSLIVDFKERLDGHSIKQQFDKICTLFQFLVGQTLFIEEIQLAPSEGFINNASMYYASSKKERGKNRQTILFPLGKDIIFDQSNTPTLPLFLFEKFYLLNDIEYGFFAKYLRYKSMSNPEEKFLGFFRILEKITFNSKEFLDTEKLNKLISRAKPYLYKKFGDKRNVDSFLKGLSRYNRSKYNTEKCIQDFFHSIPESTTKNWKYNKSDIGGICKLRNDIIHANDYYISDSDLIEKMYFIEILLIFALSHKIGFCTEFSAKFITRFEGYRNIQNGHDKIL